MELIGEDRAVTLYDDMALHAHVRQQSLTQMSGGSAANTAVVVAAMGGRAGFVGKVREDDLGRHYADDLRGTGVRYDTSLAADGAPSGRSMINITPDAERTMCTFLGAALGLRGADIADALVSQAAVTYVEGYLWDVEAARPGLHHAIDVCHEHGKRFSLTLSDAFCVDRFRHEWIDLAHGHIDVLFGNDAELCSLFETADLQHAVAEARKMCEIVAITRGAKGSLVVSGDETHVVDAFPVAHVVDTTGAGDSYAGGFLFGLTQGLGLRRCAELGGLAAAEVISHIGARPTPRLHEMIAHHS